MKLFNEQKIEAKAKELFSGTKNRSAFLTGVIYSEKIILPLFVEFGTWLAENYVPITINGGLKYWIKDYQKIKPQYSTDQLFEIWKPKS